MSAGRRQGRYALGRRAAPRRLMPAAAETARPPAPGRTDQPSRRGIGGLARAFPAILPRYRGGRYPRPLLPRQRRRLDPRARSRQRHSLGGQLLLLARAEGEAAGTGREAGAVAPAHLAARAGLDP